MSITQRLPGWPEGCLQGVFEQLSSFSKCGQLWNSWVSRALYKFRCSGVLFFIETSSKPSGRSSWKMNVSPLCWFRAGLWPSMVFSLAFKGTLRPLCQTTLVAVNFETDIISASGRSGPCKATTDRTLQMRCVLPSYSFCTECLLGTSGKWGPWYVPILLRNERVPSVTNAILPISHLSSSIWQ